MSQLGRFDNTFLTPLGLAAVGASVAVYREGATVNGNQASTSPATFNVRHRGKIAAGDSVFIGTATGTTYSVDSVTATTVVVSGFVGTLNVSNGDRLTPANNLPTLYSDDQGGATTGNPLTTSALGRANCWMEFGAYDLVVSGGGLTATAFTSQISPTEAIGQIRQASSYASGAGTAGSPWTGWEIAFDAGADNVHVHFGIGTYAPVAQTSDTGNAVTLGNNCIVSGSGWASRIVVPAGWTFGNLFYASGKSGITIRDLYIEGPNNATTSSSNEGVQFVGVTDSLIERVEATKWRHGFALNSDVLPNAASTERVTVRNCYSHANKSLGITLKYGGTFDCRIENNDITACTGGISITHDCSRNVIKNNRIYALTSGVGIKVGGIGTGGAGVTSNHNLIDGNDVSGCTTGGIYVGDDAGLFSENIGNRIVNNHVHDCVTGSAIVFSSNSSGIVSHNEVFNMDEAVSDAINVSGRLNGGTTYASSDNVVSHNIVYDVAGVGIHLNGIAAANSADRNAINNNIIRTAGSDGIRIEGMVGGSCQGNVVTNCTGYGISFNNNTANRNIEMGGGNHLAGNTSGGIGLIRQTITAVGQAILVKAAPHVRISADASYTLTSAPTIADGYDGQIINVVNEDGVDSITLQDQGTLASSNLRLMTATVVLSPRDSLPLQFNETIGDWVQIGPLATVI